MRICIVILAPLLVGCSSEYLVYKEPGHGLVSYVEFNEVARGETGIVQFIDGTERNGRDFHADSDSVDWLEEAEALPGGELAVPRRTSASGLEFIRFTGRWRGMVDGAGAGIALGWTTGSLLEAATGSTSSTYSGFGTIAIGAAGMIVGAIVGPFVGHDYVYRFNWKSEVKASLR